MEYCRKDTVKKIDRVKNCGIQCRKTSAFLVMISRFCLAIVVVEQLRFTQLGVLEIAGHGSYPCVSGGTSGMARHHERRKLAGIIQTWKCIMKFCQRPQFHQLCQLNYSCTCSWDHLSQNGPVSVQLLKPTQLNLRMAQVLGRAFAS